MTQWGLDTLFNPAKRHMDDEKRRLQSTREEVGDNSGGNRINLESGKVTIRKRDDDDDAEDVATGGTGTTDPEAGRAVKPNETPAQARARARREAARKKKAT